MTDDADRRPASARWRWPLTFLGVVLLFGGSAGLLLQVDVMHEAAGGDRACGSAFDVIADRSGWQAWWASDLDEPDADARSAL
ncbi:MAG: hypothetical protein OES57_18910, partial [Acidimicrobiia bacterium]|nr:hypothetical protein [Acidimicrobiia bacterium]